MNATSSKTKLAATLGPVALTLYAVGDILGAGIYALIGEVAEVAGTWTWLAFAVAFAVAIFTALSYAELGARFPRSGGAAYYAEQGFGSPRLSFMIGWLVFVSSVVSMAALSRAFVGYFSSVGLSASETIVLPIFLLVIAAINFRGILQSSWANAVATTVEVSGLLIVLWVGFTFLSSEPVTVTEAVSEGPLTAGAILGGAALAFYAFVGFEDLANVAEEARHPTRDIPRAIIIALVSTSLLYIAITAVATAVVSVADLAGSSSPLVEVVRRARPEFPTKIFSMVAMFAVANTCLLNSITGSRLLYGLAEDGLLPRALSKVHPRYKTPSTALLVVFPVAFLLATIGDLGMLAGASGALILVVFFVTNLSLWKVKKRGEKHDGFKVPIVSPLIAAAMNVIMVISVPTKSLGIVGVLVTVGLSIGWWRFRK